MRVAVVSHHKSLGGGSRFVTGLLGGLTQLVGDQISELVLYLHEEAPEKEAFVVFARENPTLSLKFITDHGGAAESAQTSGRKSGLRERLRQNPGLVAGYRFLKFTVLRRPQQAATARYVLSAEVLGQLEDFDVVYVTWPRLLEPPNIARPMVATFHDFNQRHGFAVFSPEERAFVDAEVTEWLGKNVHPVVSTPFIAEELECFYPERLHSPSVVFLSDFVVREPERSAVERVVADRNLTGGYLHCPTNVGPHKNVVRLIRAFGMLRSQGFGLPLVFTGGGTQMIGRDPENEWLYNTPLKASIDAINGAIRDTGLQLGSDFFSLGYVSDQEVDSLVSGATIVVAPSLYEAGTGPGLDAWRVGTAVAVSAIPPVIEQMSFLGTQAQLFDPEDEGDIAAAILALAEDPAKRDLMQAVSQVAMRRYTWKQVAEGYVRVFRRAISAHVGSAQPSSAVPLRPQNRSDASHNETEVHHGR